MKRKIGIISTMVASGLLVVACGGGGGGSSASTSVVEGNVSEQVASLLRREHGFAQRLADEFTVLRDALAAVSGVVVRVRDTELASQTDENGFFRLEGEFEGDIVLDFELPNASVSLQISVPNGGRVVLQDITINTTSGQAVPTQTIVDDSSDDDSSSNDDDNSNDDDSNSNSDDSNSNDDDSNSNDDDSNSNSDEDSNSNSDDDSNSNDHDSNSNEDDSNSNGDDDNDDNDNSGSGGGDDDGDDS